MKSSCVCFKSNVIRSFLKLFTELNIKLFKVLLRMKICQVQILLLTISVVSSAPNRGYPRPMPPSKRPNRGNLNHTFSFLFPKLFDHPTYIWGLLKRRAWRLVVQKLQCHFPDSRTCIINLDFRDPLRS